MPSGACVAAGVRGRSQHLPRPLGASRLHVQLPHIKPLQQGHPTVARCTSSFMCSCHTSSHCSGHYTLARCTSPHLLAELCLRHKHAVVDALRQRLAGGGREERGGPTDNMAAAPSIGTTFHPPATGRTRHRAQPKTPVHLRCGSTPAAHHHSWRMEINKQQPSQHSWVKPSEHAA